MLKDITLGQYYPGNSVIHRLDPRVKLLTTILYIVSLFVMEGLAGFLVATGFMVFCISLSQVPWKLLLKGLNHGLFQPVLYSGRDSVELAFYPFYGYGDL